MMFIPKASGIYALHLSETVKMMIESFKLDLIPLRKARKPRAIIPILERQNRFSQFFSIVRYYYAN